MSESSESRFAAKLTAAAGDLATDATVRMEASYPWYRQLSADERAWVGLVAQAGISAFLDWVADPREAPQLTADVFGSAPRELARIISLEQTVALVRTTIHVVESAIDELMDEPDRSAAREATLRYSREIAFSAAEVYARAAEARGAWDARLEALVVDSILRDDIDPSLTSRVSALGWAEATPIAVVAGYAPIADVEGSLDVLRRAARNHDLMLLTGMHGDFLIALIGHSTTDDHATRAARLIAPHFGPGPVVLGERAEDFDDVGTRVRTATIAVRAAGGWPNAPRPVSVVDLLPERTLAGDPQARLELIEVAYRPLAAEPHLMATAEAYLERTPSLEATARELFVHSNTVRYRLSRIAETTGFSATEPRGGLALRLALILGRIEGSVHGSTEHPNL
ncbi:MAG: hypothetical protein RLZZ163_338 [Actinomycetota bacterium]